MKSLTKYPAYGIWHVTTEGDCEGRSVRDLGAHEGYIDEIAFALADRCYYALKFKLAKALDMKPKSDTVCVGFDIDSGSWDIHGDELVAYWEDILKDRDVTVIDQKYFASVEIARGRDSPLAKTRLAEKIKQERDNALRKLTVRERKLLGLR